MSARGRAAEGRSAPLNFELFCLAGPYLDRGNLQEIPETTGRDVGACGVCAGRRGRGWACIGLLCARVCDALYGVGVAALPVSWCTTMLVHCRKIFCNLLCKPWKHRLYEERGCQECCTLVSEVSAQHGRDSKKDCGSSTCGIDAFDYLPRKSSPDQGLPGLVNQTQNSRPNSLG